MKKLVFNEGKTLIAGILNITPDSFSDGNEYINPKAALKRVEDLCREGADCIDIGAESSRPGSSPVREKEEIKRILPVLKDLKKNFEIPISVDTYKPNIAKMCLDEGADIVNDISGFASAEMICVVGEYKPQVIVMHMKGKPLDMQENPRYDDVLSEISSFLKERVEVLKNAGVKDIILDPGIGFGKALEHNLSIIKNLSCFKKLGYPILIGTSRKSFIGQISGGAPKDRLAGTIASCVIAVINGADIVRVHDVGECKKALMIADAVKKENKCLSQSAPL